MANNSLQITQLIDRLHERTLAGSLKWDRSVVRGNYQARIGNFIVQVEPGLPMMGEEDVNLTVRRLDGTVIETAGGRLNSFAATLGTGTAISPAVRLKLIELYKSLSTESEELSELIGLLR